MGELDRLIREQKADDTDRVDAERLGGLRTIALDATDDSDRGAPNLAYVEPGFERAEREADGRSAKPKHNEAERAAVRHVVAALPEFEQEVFYHVFGQGLSVRECAREMRAPSHMRVQRAVDTIKEACAVALAGLNESA